MSPRAHHRHRPDANSRQEALACRVISSRYVINVVFRTIAIDFVVVATLLLLCLGVSDVAVADAAAAPPIFPQQQLRQGSASTTPASSGGKCKHAAFVNATGGVRVIRLATCQASSSASCPVLSRPVPSRPVRPDVRSSVYLGRV